MKFHFYKINYSDDWPRKEEIHKRIWIGNAFPTREPEQKGLTRPGRETRVIQLKETQTSWCAWTRVHGEWLASYRIRAKVA